MTCPAGDPADPRVWFRLFVAAVAGLQRKDTTAASAYVAFTLKHRGPEQAEASKASIRACARHKWWADAHKIETA